MRRVFAAFALAAALVLAAAPGAFGAGAIRVRVAPYRVGGRPPFVQVGHTLLFRGYVTPYVAGQRVRVAVVHQGRTVRTVLASVARNGGRGRFTVRLAPSGEGELHVVATHAATAQQAAFSVSSRGVQVIRDVSPGARSQSVRVLQWELAALHFAVPVNGVFEEATGRALIAYRKAIGAARVPYAGQQVLAGLARGAGAFRVRYRGDGRHVEANLALQLLAEIEPGGRVYRVYTMSSGKPSTPTVLGRFRVYRKEPGVNSEGMVDSNYFYTGYAIHGYPEVPTYAASHGCLRVPIPDAPAIWNWVRIGTRVDVYY
ncbi:MAG TPA: L,D-transpeptidase [Solirubrobacteraceae bacterium]|nr:L,D-transpeptidase [Solirubrobacteraceae bacterium]